MNEIVKDLPDPVLLVPRRSQRLRLKREKALFDEKLRVEKQNIKQLRIKQELIEQVCTMQRRIDQLRAEQQRVKQKVRGYPKAMPKTNAKRKRNSELEVLTIPCGTGLKIKSCVERGETILRVYNRPAIKRQKLG